MFDPFDPFDDYDDDEPNEYGYADSDDEGLQQSPRFDSGLPSSSERTMSDEANGRRLLMVAQAAGDVGEAGSSNQGELEDALAKQQEELQKEAERQQQTEDMRVFRAAKTKRNQRLDAQTFDETPPMALWSLWMQSLVRAANASAEQSARFEENANWVEDLQFGPNDFGRIYSGGFVRQPVDGKDDIVWMVKNGDEVTALATATTVLQLCADWINDFKSKGTVDQCPFEPMRLPLVNVNRQRQTGYADDAGVAQTAAEAKAAGKKKAFVKYRYDEYKLPMLDNVTGLVLEEPIPAQEFVGGMRRVKEAKGGKWKRNADGSYVLVPRRGAVMHSTDVLRMVVQPIRLNEHHFEWQYSRWLKNERMFEPATLFTGLRDAENSWRQKYETEGCPELTHHKNSPGDPRLWSGSSLAIPLMTPGSMNALGVVVQQPPDDKLVKKLSGTAHNREAQLQTRQKSLNPKTALDGLVLPLEDGSKAAGERATEEELRKFGDLMPRFGVGPKSSSMPPINKDQGSVEYSLGEVDGYYYTIYDEAPTKGGKLKSGQALSHKAILVRASRYEPDGTYKGQDKSSYEKSGAPRNRYSSFHINAIGIDGDAYEWLVNGTRPPRSVLNTWERLFYGGGIVRVQSPALDGDTAADQQWRKTIGPMHDMRINTMYPNRDRDQALRFTGAQGGEHRRVYSEVYSRVFFEPVALQTMTTFPKASARYNHVEEGYVKEDHPCEGEYMTYSFRWAQWKRARQDEYLERLVSKPAAQKDNYEAADTEGEGEEDAMMARDDVEDEELEGGWGVEVNSEDVDTPMLPGGQYAPSNPREHRYIPPRVHPRFRRELSPLYAEVVMRRPHGENKERIRARINDVTRALRGERGWDKGKHPAETVHDEEWTTEVRTDGGKKKTWLKRQEVDDRDTFAELRISKKMTAASVFEKKTIDLPGGKQGTILRPKGTPEDQKALLDAVDKDGMYRYMSPTTVGAAMERFVRDNRRQLDFYPNVENGGCKDYLLPKIGPKGLYLSPRMDHGREERCGGVDSFFPVSDDATVYELADIQMVRGLHEILRDKDKPGKKTRDEEADEEEKWKLTKARWGPPEWYTKERAEQQKSVDSEGAGWKLAFQDYETSTDKGFHGYKPKDASHHTGHKDMKWYNFFAAYAGARGSLEKTLEAQYARANPKRSAFGRNPRKAVKLNQFQKQRLDMGHLGNANAGGGSGLDGDGVPGTATSLLERALWNIWNADENADSDKLPKYRLPAEIPFFNSMQDRDKRINGMSVLAHSATDESKRMLDGRVGGFSFIEANGPLLETISEIEDDGERQESANQLMKDPGLAKDQRKGARLPHEEDMYDELMVVYPNRLSPASRAAVYDRMKAMDRSSNPDIGAGYRGLGAVLEEGMKGYVPEDRDMAVPGQRALDPRKPGKMLAPQRDALKEQRAASGRSTVVAPVYVVILDHDDYENARKEGDIEWAKLMQKHQIYFKEADRYRLLFDADGRAAGMEVNRDYVLPGKAFPPRTAGDPRTFDAPNEDEDWPFTAGGTSYGTLEFCTRPEERMRESWFRDRKLHGGRNHDPKTLKQRIEEWEAQYEAFKKSKDEIVVKANVLGTSIRLQQNALRYATLHATWFGGKFVDDVRANNPMPDCCIDGKADNFRMAEVLTQLSDFGTNCFELRELVTGMNTLYRSVKTLKDDIERMDDPQLKAEALATNVWFRAAANQAAFRWPRESQIDALIRTASRRAAQLLLAILGNLSDGSRNEALKNAANRLFYGSATFPLRYQTEQLGNVRDAEVRIEIFQRDLKQQPEDCLSAKKCGAFLALVDGAFQVLRDQMEAKIKEILQQPDESAAKKVLDEHFRKKWNNRGGTNVGDVGDSSVARLTLLSENYCRQPRRVRLLRQYVDIVDSKTPYVGGGRAAAAAAAAAAASPASPVSPVVATRRSTRRAGAQGNARRQEQFMDEETDAMDDEPSPAPAAAPDPESLVNPEPHRPNMDLLLLGELIGALQPTPSMNYRLGYYNELEILDSKFRRRMERRAGLGDNFNPARIASVVGGTDVDASVMATLEIVSRTCNLMAQGDEAGQLVADALMGKLTSDLEEEAGRLKAQYDNTFGIGQNMPSMVLAAAVAAKKLHADKLEAAKKAKEGAQTEILVKQAVSAANKTLNGSWRFFLRATRMLKLERIRLYALFTDDALTRLGLPRTQEFAMHGKDEKNVAELIKQLSDALTPTDFAKGLRRVKAEVVFPGDDMVGLRAEIADEKPPIHPGEGSERIFRATLERVVRYTQLVVATAARLAKAKDTIDKIRAMNDAQRGDWAKRVKANFVTATTRQRERIKRADLAYKKLMHKAFPDTYDNPTANEEAQAAKKVKKAEAVAEKQRQKEFEEAQEKREKNAELAQERQQYIQLYKTFLKKRAAWNAKVMYTLDRIAVTRMEEYRRKKAAMRLQGNHLQADALVAPTKIVLRALMNAKRKKDPGNAEFENMRQGYVYKLSGEADEQDGVTQPAYMRPPKKITRLALQKLRQGRDLNPEVDWVDFAEFVWEERAEEEEDAAAADVIQEEDAAAAGVIREDDLSQLGVPMEDDPGPSSSAATSMETGSDSERQDAEQAEQDDQLRRAVADNAIDATNVGMITFEEVDLADLEDVFASFEPALAETGYGEPVLGQDRMREIINKFVENALSKAKYVEPGPSTKLHMVEMDKYNIDTVLKALETTALERYELYQATVREVAEAQDELLRMLPILVEAGPPSRSDLGLDRLNEALHTKANTAESVFSPDSRLGGGWKAAYHDYVYSMMLFRFPKGIGEIESRLTAVPLTPMQWARSELANGAYPPLRWLPPAAPEEEPVARSEAIDQLLDAEESFAKRYGPWIPYGFDFAPVMPTAGLALDGLEDLWSRED